MFINLIIFMIMNINYQFICIMTSLLERIRSETHIKESDLIDGEFYYNDSITFENCPLCNCNLTL